MFKFLKMLFNMASKAAESLAKLAYAATKIFIGIPCSIAYTVTAGALGLAFLAASYSAGYVTRTKSNQKKSKADPTSKALADGLFSSIGAVWGWSVSPVTDFISDSAESLTESEKYISSNLASTEYKEGSPKESPKKLNLNQKQNKGPAISTAKAEKLNSKGKKPRGRG